MMGFAVLLGNRFQNWGDSSVGKPELRSRDPGKARCCNPSAPATDEMDTGEFSDAQGPAGWTTQLHTRESLSNKVDGEDRQPKLFLDLCTDAMA